MTTGVLIYCFDTEKTKYHKLLERCVRQVREHLALDITVVTNFETFNRLGPLGHVNYKLIQERIGNTRTYRGSVIPWHNKERVMAYDHSPYVTTILMDCDYFVFSNRLLELSTIDFDLMLHDKVVDLTGADMIEGKDESTLPLVWATVVLFRKGKNTRVLFDMIKHVQKFYTYYCNLYRIKYKNYRNDYAFAIAMHQLNIGTFLPEPMPVLADVVEIIDNDSKGIIFKHNGDVNLSDGQDLHIMGKEWCNE